MIRNPPHRFGQGDTRRIIMISWQTELGHPGKTGSSPFWVDKTPPKTQTPRILIVERNILFQRFSGSMIHVSFRKCCVFFLCSFLVIAILYSLSRKNEGEMIFATCRSRFLPFQKITTFGMFWKSSSKPSNLIFEVCNKIRGKKIDPKGTPW